MSEKKMALGGEAASAAVEGDASADAASQGAAIYGNNAADVAREEAAMPQGEAARPREDAARAASQGAAIYGNDAADVAREEAAMPQGEAAMPREDAARPQEEAAREGGKPRCCCGGGEDAPADGGGAALGRTKERTEKEYRDLVNRLSRIEGQVRGIRGMVERNAYCTDIMTQVAAVTAALSSFNLVLLENHVRTCVARDIREGRDETVDELVATLKKLMR